MFRCFWLFFLSLRLRKTAQENNPRKPTAKGKRKTARKRGKKPRNRKILKLQKHPAPKIPRICRLISPLLRFASPCEGLRHPKKNNAKIGLKMACLKIGEIQPGQIERKTGPARLVGEYRNRTERTAPAGAERRHIPTGWKPSQTGSPDERKRPPTDKRPNSPPRTGRHTGRATATGNHRPHAPKVEAHPPPPDTELTTTGQKML